MSFYQEIEGRIDSTMQADRQRLRNLLRAVYQAEEQGRNPGAQLDKLLAQIDESTRRREARRSKTDGSIATAACASTRSS